MSYKSALWAVLFLFVAVAGCNGPPTLTVAGDCLSDSQCDDGYICNDDFRCVPGPGYKGDGDIEGEITDGDKPDGDVPDGDFIDGDIMPDGDIPDGDGTDGDLPDGDPSEKRATVTLFEVSPPAPVRIGTEVYVYADAQANDDSIPLIRFLARRGTEDFQPISGWQLHSSTSFTPSEAGLYTLRAEARHQQSTDPRGYDSQRSVQYRVIPDYVDGDVIDGDIIDGDYDWPRARLLYFDITPSSPTELRQRLTLIAQATADAPGRIEYRFAMRVNAGRWESISDYDTDPSFRLYPDREGQYQFRVDVRHIASLDPRGRDDRLIRQHNVVSTIDGDIIDGDDPNPEAVIRSFRLEPSGPVDIGETVFFNTNAISPNRVQYRYYVYNNSDGWMQVMDYPGRPIMAYEFYKPGPWVVRVQVRDIYSSNSSYDDESSRTIMVLDDVDGDVDPYNCQSVCVHLWECGYIYSGSPIADTVNECIDICPAYGLGEDEMQCLSTAACGDMMYCLEPVDGDIIDGDEPVYTCESACEHLDACGYIVPGGPLWQSWEECVQLCYDIGYDEETLECASTRACNELPQCLSQPDGDIIDGDEPICDDGNPCTQDYVTSDGRCATYPAPDGMDCAMGNPCTAYGYCFQGYCYQQPVDCGDDNECTRDSCDPDFGCINTPISYVACNDGRVCTTGDICLNGRCLGDPIVCNPGEECQIGTCLEGVGCIFEDEPDYTPCNDYDACTSNDRCMSGQCIGTAPTTCDDDNPCTRDYFDPTTCECVTEPAPNGTGCDDGNYCTVGDACQAGACVGQARSCETTTPCRVGSCNTALQRCEYNASPDGFMCDDGNLCTTGDQCLSGTCWGTPISCNDYNPCTYNRCNQDTGECTFPDANGIGCDDGLICTQSGVCYAGDCLPGDPVSCDTDNPCTAGRCVEGIGCVEEDLDDGTPCETSQYPGVCESGECIPDDPIDGDMGLDCGGACIKLEYCGALGVGSPFGETIDACTMICDQSFDGTLIECVVNASCLNLQYCFDPIDGDIIDGDVIDGDLIDGDVIDGDVIDDRDNDGIPDEADNCPQNYNPLQTNSDDDSLGDACDNCVYFTNEDQSDVDNDLVGDGCDPTPYTTHACTLVNCTSDSTCGRFGLSCGDGAFCTRSCTSNSQCPSPWTCDVGTGLCLCSQQDECPQICSTSSQCPGDLPVCADVYGHDGVKECSRNCSPDALCPDGYRCENSVCICDSLPQDTCTQTICEDDLPCIQAGWDMCLPLPWEPEPVCTTECTDADACPNNANCVDGFCVCEDPGPAQCNYGSCFTDENCWSTYGQATYCTGPWWPLFERYCTASCNTNLDCIAAFGADFYCNAAKECQCRD